MQNGGRVRHRFGALELGVQLFEPDQLLLDRATLRFWLRVDCKGDRDGGEQVDIIG